MKKLLITGASGFVGKHIYDVCTNRGYEVHGLTTSASNNFIKCDITEEGQVKQVFDQINPDIVIHSAGLASVTNGLPIDYYKINVIGTDNILKTLVSFREKKRLIFLSTAGVYGNQKINVLHEKLTPSPVHHYGFSKMVAEHLVLLQADKINFTILRLFNLIGNGQNESFILPKLIRHFKEKLPQIELGNIEPERDYISVLTAVDIIEKIISNKSSFGEVINLCSGHGTSVRSLIEVLTSITGHQLNVISSPDFIRKNEVWRLVGDVEKLVSITGNPAVLPDIRNSISSMII
ncbi:NAD(P)-dependent oxidoreductase [Rhodoferax sp.]|uniref:NAD-dependent epimerase/dehydratase family protein n=1 Tax=Rhodoferax sp. TaxID=50421 RepID=UPI0025CBFBBF|nr:NAD-dependent epimerase/dehydratase family protein [Rhodoferax sp.]